MKTLILLVFGLCTMSGFYINVFGKDPVNIESKSDTTMVEQNFFLPERASPGKEILPEKKDEIVINMEMIKRFRNIYNCTEETSPSALPYLPSTSNVNTKSNAPEFVILLPASKHRDIVINMEMINSFRRCYDRIEVIPWGELLRATPASEWGIAYTAYRRLSLKAVADSGLNFITLLTKEITTVKEDIANIPDSLYMLTNPNFKNVKPRRIVIIKNRE